MSKLIFLLVIIAAAAAQDAPVDPKVNATAELIRKNALAIFGVPDDTEDKSGSVNLDPVKGDPQLTSCVRDDGSPGLCVLYYQCDPETKKLINDGTTLIDVRISQCPNFLDVCCLTDAVNTTKPVTTTPAPPTPDATPVCGYSKMDEEVIRLNNGGSYADYLEYPWMIAVLKRTEAGAAWSQQDYLGGGSLIHMKVVLTAAHKVDGYLADEIKCRAGEWDTQTSDEIFEEQEENVQKIISHEHFYRPPVLNSIALLILEKPFRLANNIGTACIGRAMPPPGTRCYSMGWGKNNFNAAKKENSNAAILKKVDLPLLSRSDCQNKLRRTRLGSFFVLHQSLTCAGGEEGKDTCTGDGGSPLVCHIGDPKDLRYAIFGIVAYGLGCGELNVPGVYVNTVDFYSWIETKMKEEGLTTDSYTIEKV